MIKLTKSNYNMSRFWFDQQFKIQNKCVAVWKIIVYHAPTYDVFHYVPSHQWFRLNVNVNVLSMKINNLSFFYVISYSMPYTFLSFIIKSMNQLLKLSNNFVATKIKLLSQTKRKANIRCIRAQSIMLLKLRLFRKEIEHIYQL